MKLTSSRTTITPEKILATVLVALLPPPSGLAADLNVPGQYATIQKAVDAAVDGDTIHVAPGVYVEQILILRKKLTFLGQPGAVIRAHTGMNTTLQRTDLPGGGLEGTPALLAAAVSDVVLKGLTFEGEHLGEAYPQFSYMAVAFDASSGRLEDCTIRGFRTADALHPFAWGFVAANWAALGTPPLSVQVLRCAFADNGTSIAVRGDDLTPTIQRLTFTIADNTITGIGPTDLGPQAGIEIGAGAAGEVSRNTIADHFFTDTGNSESLGSMGIIAVDLLYLFGGVPSPRTLLPVVFGNNSFRANQHHLVCLKADESQAVNNNFEGLSTGFRPAGIIVSGDNMLIASNRFSSVPTGITLLGSDPVSFWVDFDDDFGLATNPRLLQNRFCNVGTPIDIGPSTSGVTEEGTLLCPFPDPTLEITPAVILSWPSDTEGWILESAPTVDGSWTVITATTRVEGDQNTVAINTGTQQRFFRLRQP